MLGPIAREIIDAALASRGMAPLPAAWVCPCCGDAMDPDDQAAMTEFRHAAELVERYGQMPCIACADDHDLCAQCGKATSPDDEDFRRNDDHHAEPFCCGACQGEWWRNFNVGRP